MTNLFKKTILSCLVAGIFSATTPAKAAAIAGLSIGGGGIGMGMAIWLGYVPLLGLVTGAANFAQSLNPNAEHYYGGGRMTEAERKEQRSRGFKWIWVSLLILDESPSFQLAELNVSAKAHFGLTDRELRSYNENRSALRALIDSQTAELQNTNNLSLAEIESAHGRLHAAAKEELPAEAFSAYEKIVRTARMEHAE